MDGADDFEFQLEDELSADSAVALRVVLPDGRRVLVWADVELSGRIIVLRQLLIEGLGFGANSLGLPMLRRMARAAMEVFDVDGIRIEETRRITGAGSPRALVPLHFRRR